MRTSINKKSDFDFIVLDSKGNAIDMPTSNFTLDLWTWGSKCRFRASSIGGVLKGCKSDNGKLRVYVDNPGFVSGKLVGEWITYAASEEYADGSQRTCRYVSDFGIDMVDGDSTTNEQQVLAMMQYIQGASAYEIACEYGYQGTEEEWLNSLSLESVNAANECRELMAQLSAAEDVRNANEQTRIANEQARVESESSRSYEEDRRADAESTRLHNEQARQAAESIRKDAENYRITHENSREGNETMRQNSETARAAAEESRVAAEKSRQAAEQARETAEVSRAAAEEERKRTHDRLKTAMREYADAESLREEAEAERREAEQYRIEYEQSRQSAEADRLTNEHSRVATESQRVTNETARKDAEDARVANEAARQSAEATRQSNEQSRQTAEQGRVEAEQARAEEFAGFSVAIAAKEDAANKVTSINADATDLQYPSAKAVKDSLAKVKNIEVTPDMLSESTKQFINASGGGTITNFADDEDLTSVDNALKLADKTYDPITYSGMGRKYLRKNLVDGKNILTQEMLPSANTVYIIQYDYDLNGATITIPENCTLDFQGGSLGNGTISLGNTQLINNGLNCELSNITTRYGYPFSRYLQNTETPSLNRSVAQALIDGGVPLIFDTATISFDGELYLTTALYISSIGSKRTSLKFPNSRGFVWNKKLIYSGSIIENISVESLGNCFDLYNSGAADRPYNVFNTMFRNVNATSLEGDCFTSGIDNWGATKDNLAFSNAFDNVTVKADKGYGVVGFSSNTNQFTKMSNMGCAEAMFYNCSGTFMNINGCWGTCKSFIKTSPHSTGYAGSFSMMFYNCNIESYKGVLIDSPSDAVYMSLYMYNCTLYITPNKEGLVDYYPIQLGTTNTLEMKDVQTYIYNNGSYADGYALLRFYSNVYIISSDTSVTYYDAHNYKHVCSKKPYSTSAGITQSTFNSETYNNFENVQVARNLRYGILLPTFQSITISSNTYIDIPIAYEGFALTTPKESDIEGNSYTLSYASASLFDGFYKNCGYKFMLFNNTTNTTFVIKHNLGYGGRFIVDIGRDFSLKPKECVWVTFKYVGNISKSFVTTTQSSNLYVSGSSRPTLNDANIGKQFFDTTLNKPIWWTGSAWVDATGAEV